MADTARRSDVDDDVKELALTIRDIIRNEELWYEIQTWKNKVAARSFEQGFELGSRYANGVSQCDGTATVVPGWSEPVPGAPKVGKVYDLYGDHKGRDQYVRRYETEDQEGSKP